MVEPTHVDERSPEDHPGRMLAMLGLISIGAIVVVSIVALRVSSQADGDQAHRDLAETGIVAVAVILCVFVLAGLALADRALRLRSDVEDELRRSEVFLASVVENIPSMVFVKDADDLRYLKMNRAGLALLGHPWRDLIGRNDFDLFPDDLAARSTAQDRDVLDSGELLDVPAEWVLTKDGQERILHTRKIPIFGADGRPAYLLGISHDVSEQHQASVAVDMARQVADAANNAKNEFLSRMSHELRTPLNAVLGFGQLLQLERLTGDQRSSVDQVVVAGRHLLGLIDGVLDLSRVESGDLHLTLGPVSVSEVIGEAVGMMEPLAAARNVRIVVDPTACEKTFVRADRQRFTQALVNVIANAVKYNRDGGEIRITCRPMADDDVRTTIEDTGVGIAEQDMARLFIPFERLGAADSEVEGTGLGLVLTKQFVEAMAGAIGVTSTVGVGTSVWIDLPLVDAPSTSEPEAAAPSEFDLAPAPPLGPRKLLYIEDNVANVKLLERLLTSRPEITLLTAMQGRLGLEIAREHQPSLILLDVHLPDMSGEEVLLRLRADEPTNSIPVFVLSADASPGQVDRLLAAGATGYLTKPFDIPHLLSLIDTNGSLPPVESPPAIREEATLDAAVVASLHDLAALTSDGGDQMIELVAVYLHDAETRIAALGEAARDGDHRRIGDVAHSLAGSSANFGASSLASLCGRLNRDLRIGPIQDTPARLMEISTAFDVARCALRAEFFDVDAVSAE
jgi:PAS domain S-box-containing protein